MKLKKYITFFVICTLAILFALSASAETPAVLCINGEDIIASGRTSGSGWKYDASSNTLTFSGKVKLTGTEDTPHGSAIYSGGDLNIVLSDGSVVTANGKAIDGNKYMSAAVYVTGQLAVSGGGTLNTHMADGGHYNMGLYCIDLYVDGGNINSHGGNSAIYSIGLRANARLNLKNCSVTAYGGTAQYSYGFESTHNQVLEEYIKIISTDASLVGYGGTAELESMGIKYKAESGGKNFLIEDNAILTGIGGESKRSYGVIIENLEMTGGTVTATGGKADVFSIGFLTNSDIKIYGGKLCAIGGEAGMRSCGIDADDGADFLGGEIYAKGGEVRITEASDGIDTRFGNYGSYGTNFYFQSVFIKGTCRFTAVSSPCTSTVDSIKSISTAISSTDTGVYIGENAFVSASSAEADFSFGIGAASFAASGSSTVISKSSTGNIMDAGILHHFDGEIYIRGENLYLSSTGGTGKNSYALVSIGSVYAPGITTTGIMMIDTPSGGSISKIPEENFPPEFYDICPYSVGKIHNTVTTADGTPAKTAVIFSEANKLFHIVFRSVYDTLDNITSVPFLS